MSFLLLPNFPAFSGPAPVLISLVPELDYAYLPRYPLSTCLVWFSVPVPVHPLRTKSSPVSPIVPSTVLETSKIILK